MPNKHVSKKADMTGITTRLTAFAEATFGAQRWTDEQLKEAAEIHQACRAYLHKYNATRKQARLLTNICAGLQQARSKARAGYVVVTR